MKSIDKLRQFLEDQFGSERFAIHNYGYVQGMAIANIIEKEIADNYMRLPVDADGVPIHVGDEITLPNGSRDDVRFITIRKYDTVFNERGWVPNQCTHVKPRTLEDVLEDYVIEYQTRHARSEFGAEHFDHVDVHEMVKRCADEIRELLGGDAE